MFDTITVGGLPIAVLSNDDVTDIFMNVVDHFETGQAPYVSTSANGEVLARAHANAEIKNDLLQADMINADGMPLVWASRIFTSKPLPERVVTTDLFHYVARRAILEGKSFFMLGASPQEIALAVKNVQKQYPTLNIVGFHHGYIADFEALVDMIEAASPDILWLGMGVPGEQAYALKLKAYLTAVPVIKTCGGLFNYLSGTRSRAPLWMQNLSLEWLYRFYLEPKRLGWRYISTNPIAAWHLLTKTH